MDKKSSLKLLVISIFILLVSGLLIVLFPNSSKECDDVCPETEREVMAENQKILDNITRQKQELYCEKNKGEIIISVLGLAGYKCLIDDVAWRWDSDEGKFVRTDYLK